MVIHVICVIWQILNFQKPRTPGNMCNMCNIVKYDFQKKRDPCNTCNMCNIAIFEFIKDKDPQLVPTILRPFGPLIRGGFKIYYWYSTMLG